MLGIKKISLTDELLDRFAREYICRTAFGVRINRLITFHEYVDRRKEEIEREINLYKEKAI